VYSARDGYAPVRRLLQAPAMSAGQRLRAARGGPVALERVETAIEGCFTAIRSARCFRQAQEACR